MWGKGPRWVGDTCALNGKVVRVAGLDACDSLQKRQDCSGCGPVYSAHHLASSPGVTRVWVPPFWASALPCKHHHGVSEILTQLMPGTLAARFTDLANPECFLVPFGNFLVVLVLGMQIEHVLSRRAALQPQEIYFSSFWLSLFPESCVFRASSPV